MKKLLSIFLVVLALALPAHSAPAPAPKPRDIKTTNGVTYHNATILGRNSSEIMIACDEGTIYIPIENLPPDLQTDTNKVAADKAVQDKAAKIESSKHEFLPGTEKHPFPELNPDYFPAELASQITSYDTKAQFSNLLASGGHSADTDTTLKANTDKLADLRAIYENYKTFIEKPPAGTDVDAARKAVAAGDYKPYTDMPEIVFEAIRGIPDKVETSKAADNATEVKTYSYGDFKFLFQNGKFWQLKAPQK
jgi:hypothetical protein